MATRSRENITGLEKAAILMVLLGEKVASGICRHLPQPEIEALTREISHLDYIPHEVAAQILDEFSRLVLSQNFAGKGGAEYAQKLLISAFGENSARDVIQQVTRSEALSRKDLEIVHRSDPQELAKLLQDESPQIVALFLAHLDAKTSSMLLRLFPEDLKAEVVERLAKLKPFAPEMVQKIFRALIGKIQALGKPNRQECGGVEAVVDLLKRLGGEASKPILESIEQQDPDLAAAIRDRMFIFDDFLSVPEVSVREVVAQIDKKVLALALKGATPEVKEHFLKVMSSRAAEMLNEDIDVLGAVRSEDVAHAQQEIVQAARKLEAEGKIVLQNEGEENV